MSLWKLDRSRNQIEVEANATLVETRNSGVGQVVENARILELPLNGRNVTELVALAGAAAPAVTLTGSSRDPFAQGNVSVAGGLNSGLNYKLDGADHNNPFQGSYLSMPFPDAMQEFKVETSATSAKQGGKSAGEVSLVTKSGTNEFHGDLFEFVRNGIFNARNAFAPTTRYAEAQSVRRHGRRTDYEKQAVLLRRIPGHENTAAHHRKYLLTCRPRPCWPATSRTSPQRRAITVARSRSPRLS